MFAVCSSQRRLLVVRCFVLRKGKRTASILLAKQPRSSREKRPRLSSVERALPGFPLVVAHRVFGVWVGCEMGKIVDVSGSNRG